jgi:chloride channel 3/4/5
MFCLLVFTYGLRVPSGLFVPSLAIGACVGRILGIAIALLYE